jgi:pimeloyl-ACP methyl ester carboxylesterase
VTVDTAQRARPRTLEEAKAWMHDKLAKRVHPLGLTDPRVTAALIDQLAGLDGHSWAKVWGGAGVAHAEQATAAERAGNLDEARRLYLQAYGFYFLGRFPCPNHPRKLECYRLEREAYLNAGRLMTPPIRRVTVPFDGLAGEGKEVVFYVRRPEGVSRPKVVVMWGGVDAWKEEMTELSNGLLARGLATVAMDNVGTGESPVVAVPDADRQFIPVLDWVASQPDLDGRRPAILGRSFGGYWATKLAHLYPERLAAAVNWGGGAHFMFQRSWVEASRHPESYLMELVETRSRMLGATNDAEYIHGFARLSLLDQRLLDRPCAPLLLINGKEDRQCPIDDIFLLLDHGKPKSVRLFPGGHMGFGPHTVPTIVDWVSERLGGKA